MLYIIEGILFIVYLLFVYRLWLRNKEVRRLKVDEYKILFTQRLDEISRELSFFEARDEYDNSSIHILVGTESHYSFLVSKSGNELVMDNGIFSLKGTLGVDDEYNGIMLINRETKQSFTVIDYKMPFGSGEDIDKMAKADAFALLYEEREKIKAKVLHIFFTFYGICDFLDVVANEEQIDLASSKINSSHHITVK